jgi:hypothetical protein
MLCMLYYNRIELCHAMLCYANLRTNMAGEIVESVGIHCV